MTPALRFTSRLARSAALFAAAAAGPAFGQAHPPGGMPAPGMPIEAFSGPAVPGMAAGDPFAGGAYAVPTAPPVAMAYADPATLAPGTISTGPTTSGGPVYMAPQVVGSPTLGSPIMGSPMPGSPGCNCGAGGAAMMGAAPMMSDPSMMAGMPVAGPTYGAPMMDPGLGACPPAYGGGCDDGCCLTGCCLTGGCLDGIAGGPVVGGFDPCQTAAPVCDPCQQGAPGGAGGLYQSMGGTPRCGWAAGYSWVFLKPYLGTNDALTVTTFGPGGAVTTETPGFDYSLDTGSRVFVEKIGRRDLGVRATYFTLSSGADGQTVNVQPGQFAVGEVGGFAVPGDTLTAGNKLRLNVVDLDLTQRFQAFRSIVNVGGGVRWAEFKNNYSADVNSPIFGATSSSASRRFNGIGPSLFAELRRPLGMSRFAVIAAVRGSMLYGQGTNNTSNAVPAGLPILAGPVSSHSENDDFVAIGESQLGVEWSTWISSHTVLFVQTAWETQYWLGVGSALDRNGDLGLFGFNTSVGLEW